LNISALTADCQAPRDGLVIVNAASTYAGFALIGGAIEEMLRQLTAIDVSTKAFPPGTCAQTNLAGVPTLLARVQESSVPAIRIYVPSDLAEYEWEHLMVIGKRWNIAPVGLEAWSSLQIHGRRH
jgi:heterotetrameric sarcosine oxidase gamma subunit